MSDVERLEQHQQTAMEAIGSLVAIALRHWRTLALSVVLAGGLGVIVALSLPEIYEADAVLLPPSSGGMSSLLGQFAQLPAAVGLDLGGASSGDVYPAVAHSRALLGRVLDHEYREGATYRDVLLVDMKRDSLADWLVVEELAGDLKAVKNLKGGTVTLRFRHTDPYVAAGLLNVVLQEMDAFYRSEVSSDAGAQLDLLERRLVDVRAELLVAENGLASFREANRGIQQSPQLMLEEGRLLRSVQLQNELFVELSRQKEVVKIRLAGEEEGVRILDHATVPFLRVAPRRSLIVIAVTGVIVLLVFGFLVLRERSREGRGV